MAGYSGGAPSPIVQNDLVPNYRCSRQKEVWVGRFRGKHTGPRRQYQQQIYKMLKVWPYMGDERAYLDEHIGESTCSGPYL